MGKHWETKIEGNNVYKLVKRMKIVRNHMNKLNWKNVNLFENVIRLREELKQAQVRAEANPHNSQYKMEMS